MQLRGGFGEIQVFRHGNEIPQVTQFHIVTGSLASLNVLATGQSRMASRSGRRGRVMKFGIDLRYSVYGKHNCRDLDSLRCGNRLSLRHEWHSAKLIDSPRT